MTAGWTKTRRSWQRSARTPTRTRRNIMSSTTEKRKVGDLRPSQLLYTFGVGAIVELPNLSVMVMGLSDWPIEQGAGEIVEPRLLQAVQHELAPQVAKLLTPPVTPESSGYQASP